MAPDFIETPLAAARAAREYVLMTAFLWEAVQRGSVTIEQLAHRLPLDENNNVAEWSGPRTQEYLRTWTWNIFLSSFAISAQGIDRALDDAFGPKPTVSPGMSDLDTTRTVMYLIRCAFAHDPFNPRWEIKPSNRLVFRIPKIRLELDAAALHGRELVVVDHLDGPMGYLNLLNLCIKFLEQQPGPARDVRGDSGLEAPPS